MAGWRFKYYSYYHMAFRDGMEVWFGLVCVWLGILSMQLIARTRTLGVAYISE